VQACLPSMEDEIADRETILGMVVEETTNFTWLIPIRLDHLPSHRPTADQMKFVALLSGGKDSCYNIVHCTANGHELVAAASLRPPPGQGRYQDQLIVNKPIC
jgi:hypothetical protein